MLQFADGGEEMDFIARERTRSEKKSEKENARTESERIEGRIKAFYTEGI